MATPMRATQTFFWGQRIIALGDIVQPDDPVLRKHSSLFEPVIAPAGVEQATAAPGEKRSVRRPPKET